MICPNCGKDWTFEGHCSDKSCGKCNARRRRRITGPLLKEIEKMKAPKFLTLTLRSQPLTREQVSRIRKAFTRLTRRRKWLASGGFYVLEIGERKETGLWNLHLHAVIDSDFMPQKWISDTWLKITGDSMIVDIRAVRSYRYAVHYLTKYVSKPVQSSGEDLTSPDWDHINSVLKNQRLVQRFGNAIAVGMTRKKRPFYCDCGQYVTLISQDYDVEPFNDLHPNVSHELKRRIPLPSGLDKFGLNT